MKPDWYIDYCRMVGGFRSLAERLDGQYRDAIAAIWRVIDADKDSGLGTGHYTTE